MNAPWRPGSAGRPFKPHELDGADEGPFHPRELAEALGAARELESASAEAHPLAISASTELVDRVMAAIATEPLPAPARTASRAVRSRRFRAAIAAIGDAWHVARSGGRPVVLRVQALSLVLLVFIALGSLGGLVAVGTFNLLGPHPTESPIPVASSTPEPSPSPTPTPTSSPSPSPTPSPSVTPSDGASPTGSTEPTSTNQSGESGGGSGARPTPTRTASPTARPTDTPEPTSTEDHGGGGGETPRPTDDSGGGSGGGGGSGDGGSGSGSGGATSTPGG